MIRRPPKSTLFPSTTSFRSRRQAADGGLLPRQGDRARLPAALEDARAGHDRLCAADGRRVSQLRGGEDPQGVPAAGPDRKSTRLNSSHANISYAVFCLKNKK